MKRNLILLTSVLVLIVGLTFISAWSFTGFASEDNESGYSLTLNEGSKRTKQVNGVGYTFSLEYASQNKIKVRVSETQTSVSEIVEIQTGEKVQLKKLPIKIEITEIRKTFFFNNIRADLKIQYSKIKEEKVEAVKEDDESDYEDSAEESEDFIDDLITYSAEKGASGFEEENISILSQYHTGLQSTFTVYKGTNWDCYKSVAISPLWVSVKTNMHSSSEYFSAALGPQVADGAQEYINCGSKCDCVFIENHPITNQPEWIPVKNLDERINAHLDYTSSRDYGIKVESQILSGYGDQMSVVSNRVTEDYIIIPRSNPNR